MTSGRRIPPRERHGGGMAHSSSRTGRSILKDLDSSRAVRVHPIVEQGLCARGYPYKTREAHDESHRKEQKAGCPDQQGQAG